MYKSHIWKSLFMIQPASDKKINLSPNDESGEDQKISSGMKSTQVII